MIERQKSRTFYNDLTIAARNMFRIAENGRLLRNEGLYIFFLEMCGMCKVKKDGIYIYAQKKRNSMVEIDSDGIMIYVLSFLDLVGQSDISDFIIDNDFFFSPEILDALKEEVPVTEFDNYIEIYGEDEIAVISKDEFIIESEHI